MRSMIQSGDFGASFIDTANTGVECGASVVITDVLVRLPTSFKPRRQRKRTVSLIQQFSHRNPADIAPQKGNATFASENRPKSFYGRLRLRIFVI